MSARAVLLSLDPELQKSAEAIFAGLKVRIEPVPDPAKLVEILAKEKIQIALTRESAEEKKTEELIAAILGASPSTSVLVSLQTHSMRRAVELMAAGARDCIEPSVLDSDLEKILKQAIERAENEPVRFPPKIPFWKKKPFVMSLIFTLAFALGGTAFKIHYDRKKKAEAARQRYLSELQFPLPYSHPSAIAFQENYFWISDWYAQSIYKHEPDRNGFVMLAVYHLSDVNPVAIAWAESHLWVLSAGHKILKYAVSEKLKLRQSARSPGNNPSGMAFDGKYLWTSDTGTRKVYRHVLDDRLTVEAEFDYPGTPVALFCDGNVLWSLDSAANRLIRHRVEQGKLIAEESIQVSRPELKRVGATFDGERFWTLSEQPPLAIRHAMDGPGAEAKSEKPVSAKSENMEEKKSDKKSSDKEKKR